MPDRHDRCGRGGEIITKDNALVCPVGDKECLAKQIRLAIENKGMRDRLARNAREAWCCAWRPEQRTALEQ